MAYRHCGSGQPERLAAVRRLSDDLEVPSIKVGRVGTAEELGDVVDCDPSSPQERDDPSRMELAGRVVPVP